MKEEIVIELPLPILVDDGDKLYEVVWRDYATLPTGEITLGR